MRRVMLVLAGAMIMAIAPAAFAGGANVYPNGAEGFWMGAAPPPGTYYQNYTLWYNAHEYKNEQGHEFGGPFGGFKTDVVANVHRFIYISDKRFCNANWGAHIFVPVQDVNVDTAGGNSHVTGLGDIIVDPFILAWHWPSLHIIAGLDIYLPTGSYDSGRIANTSANTYVLEPVLAFTYMTPMKGLTTSFKFMYDFPGENEDFVHPFVPGMAGDLQYGEEFHFDYSFDYMVNESWKVGVGGYYYRQTTDDELEGVKIRNNKGEVFAIGPGLEYGKKNWLVSFRTQFEMEAENRPEGVSNWLRLVYIFPQKSQPEAPAPAAAPAAEEKAK